MAIQFSEVIKQGGGTMELNVLDPSSSGVDASISTIGTSTDNKQWVKIGVLDTDWRQILSSEEDGTYLANIKLVDVTETTPSTNVLGVKYNKPTLGDGDAVGGLPIAMQSDLQSQTLIGTATGTLMLTTPTLSPADIPLLPTSLHIGNSVTDISANTFDTEVTLEGSLTIPDSVTSIGINAFSGCTGFTGSLTLSNSLVAINDDTFYGCTGFTGSLTIPDSVTTIGINAFRECNSFTGELTIPDSVTTFGDNAFRLCSSFTGTLTIPDSVTSIGNASFAGMVGVTRIEIYATVAPTITPSSFNSMPGVSPAEIHVPSGATGYDASYSGLTVVYDL